MKQECNVESLNTCIDEFQRQTILSGWNWRMPISDLKNLRKNWS